MMNGTSLNSGQLHSVESGCLTSFSYLGLGKPHLHLTPFPFTRSTLHRALLPPHPPPPLCVTPLTNISNKLQEMRTHICFLSTTRKQPDNISWFEWMRHVCLFLVGQSRKAHTPVTLTVTRCKTTAVLTKQFIENNNNKKTHYAYRCWTEALLNTGKPIWRGQVHCNIAAHTGDLICI